MKEHHISLLKIIIILAILMLLASTMFSCSFFVIKEDEQEIQVQQHRNSIILERTQRTLRSLKNVR